jgi:hypothetical protein
MTIRTWHTGEAQPAGFSESWEGIARATGQFNFTMDERYLRWEAAHGRHALAVTIEGPVHTAALVLRLERGRLVSGWPWRWQVALVGSAGEVPGILTAEECRWVRKMVQELAGGRTWSLYVPAPPPSPFEGRLAGRTILTRLQHPDEALMQAMTGNRRRDIKASKKHGFAVVRSTALEDLRGHVELHEETERRRKRHGAAAESEEGSMATPVASEASPGAPVPPPGEGYREWELPWMMLLIARHEGAAHAASGFGLGPFGMVDYRTNASSDLARKHGTNAHLAFTAMQIGREEGCTVMNWGGVTPFKKQFGGSACDVYLWHDARFPRGVLNASVSAAHHVRSSLLRAVQRVRRKK